MNQVLYMKYITIFSMAIVFAGGCQKTYVSVESEKVKLSSTESHDISKAERLGEELYKMDTVAAKASHMLIQAVGPIKPGVLSGWIIVKDGPKTLTRFIKQAGEDINVIYDVRIDAKGNAEVTQEKLRPLSKAELAMFHARQNAMLAAPKDCANAYNTAVIKDTESDDWLVYILAAADRDTIMVGGHSRIKISPDGNNVESVTLLYKTCLSVPIPANVENPKDGAFSVSYPVADVPSEIHVYLNRLHGFTVYVTTAKRTWQVRDGKIAVIRQTKTEKTGQK
jgi:hypothetical protein